jgi:L-fuconolactonase
MSLLDELFAVRQDPVNEPATDADLPVIDAHHHLWEVQGFNYLPDKYLADLQGGHRVISSVFIESRMSYRSTGPDHLRPLGESAFAAEIAARYAGESIRVCDGIVGYADLSLGAAVDEVLQGHLQIAGNRFKGLRKIAFWDPDPAFNVAPYGEDRPGILLEQQFLEGFSRLSKLGLSFDVCVFHTQLQDVVRLARRFPETRIILDHIGTPLRIRAYSGRPDEIFAEWHRGMKHLAGCNNVVVKLGGLGVPHFGAKYNEDKRAPNSEELAAQWQPYFQSCIELFGPSRCMFESNAPVDLATTTYNNIWNAFKRLCAGASAEEKAWLLWRTAASVYRLDTAGRA